MQSMHTHAHTFADDNDYWHEAPWSPVEKVLDRKLLEGSNCGFGSPQHDRPIGTLLFANDRFAVATLF